MLFHLRYYTILKVLKSLGYCPPKHRIAEIGSGVPGLSGYIKGHFIGCDLKFSGAIPSNLLAVRCSVHALPFRDGSVDYVLSSDMLEHIPAGMRTSAIKEMIRVISKGLILSFPEGTASQEYDRHFSLYLKKKDKQLPPWLDEHIRDGHRFPAVKEVCSMLNDIGAEYKIYPCENLLLHSVLLRLESTAFFKAVNWRLRKLLFKWMWTMMLPFANSGKTYRSIFAVSSGFKT
jgi:ubiquinone/menaquinone biosynthesis C-methylase UbiE